MYGKSFVNGTLFCIPEKFCIINHKTKHDGIAHSYVGKSPTLSCSIQDTITCCVANAFGHMTDKCVFYRNQETQFSCIHSSKQK